MRQLRQHQRLLIVAQLRMGNMENPKLRGKGSLASSWYRFYPGFSEAFARSVLAPAALKEGQWVLDPWNGAGTTTSTAVSLGLNAYGYDLNPAMVVVSKARCLDPGEYSSLRPLEVDIRSKARRGFDVQAHDPLLDWLVPSAAAAFRSIEAAVQTLLVDEKQYLSVRDRGSEAISGVAAFFYVALFRTLKNVLSPFRTSNPTWLKRPRLAASRLRPDPCLVRRIFQAQVASMLPEKTLPSEGPHAEKILGVASSEKIPLPTDSVDYVLSSPPYCTRIDYAVATYAELSLLGFGSESGFEELRHGLIGTATVPKVAPALSTSWGRTCQKFLNDLRIHASKASATYYYKSHLQYFQALNRSMSEIARVLKPGAECVLVVQDSYYKDLHNDLPLILTEMVNPSLTLKERRDFQLSRTLAGIHPGTKEYRSSFGATESVIVFEKSLSGTHEINHVANIVQPVGRDVLGPLGQL